MLKVSLDCCDNLDFCYQSLGKRGYRPASFSDMCYYHVLVVH